jgi:cytochrome c peroxidase
MKIVLLTLSCLAATQAFQVGTRPRVASRTTSLQAVVAPVEGEEGVISSRRAFLTAAGAAATLTGLAWSRPRAALAADASVDYRAVAADVADLIRKDPDWGPTLLRLAWHSSGTYDKMTRTGGSSGGTIRFKEELAHGGNAGLGETAVRWMEPIYQKYKDAGLSYADLYTLGGGM